MKPLASPAPVVPFAAILSTDIHLFESACREISLFMNPILEILPPLPFDHTDYYCDEMGRDLVKGFIAFHPPFDQDALVKLKLLSRSVEWRHAALDSKAIHRSINIDPGFVDLSKTILATSKNFSHRIYLGTGIFAEVTLSYQAKRWATHPWTYPDFNTSRVQDFLSRCRAALAGYLATETPSTIPFARSCDGN